MNSEPTTPVRIPKAASTYTPTTQDPDLRSQINGILLRDGHVSKIQETLLQALNASPTNWPTLIQDHALALLRSGECTTFPALMTRVLEDVKADNVAARSKAGQSNGTGAGGKSVGKVTSNGEMKEGRGDGGKSLALPKSVVEEGLKVTRECLELVIDVGE